MGVETARRAREALAELIRLVNDPATPTVEVREVLGEAKGLGAQVSVLQADAAAVVAARERHGDSGVGVLARSGGLSRREAAVQVQTAQSLQSMPAVRDGLETGRISVANARTLARASGRTSTGEVDGDAELLEKATEMSADQFVREAGRWAARRQRDGGEGEYRRQRARRRLSFWDGDDGMVHLRGELDPVTGAKVRRRFAQEAERLRRADLRGPGSDKRSYDQRMADSLETLTSHGSIYSNADKAKPAGDDRRRAVDDRRGGAGGESEAGTSEDRRGPGRARAGGAGEAGGEVSPVENGGSGRTGAGGAGEAGGEVSPVENGGSGGTGAGGGKCRCGGGPPSADITIVQHLNADGTDAFAEIAGRAAIPQSVLEEYFCNASIRGVVFSSEGVPLWHGHAKRLATKAQMNALRARYGACGGCGADMWICDGHHIRPVSEGGATNIDNMMLLCWICHQKVHHHRWRVVPDGRGLHTIAPPEQIRHGPAHASDPPPQGPSPHPTRAGPRARAGPGGGPARPSDRTRSAQLEAPDAEPLFTLA